MDGTKKQHNRHDFSVPTKRKLAEESGRVCANPDCAIHTNGPKAEGSGSINQGRAAHITAAAPGGPRYDESISEDQRRHADNGIWLCTACASLIDDDYNNFSTNLLLSWKKAARDSAHLRVVKRVRAVQNIETQENEFSLRFLQAAKQDLSKFEVQYNYHGSEIKLDFGIISDDEIQDIDLDGICTGLTINSELIIISPPGTGKTISLIQLANGLLEHGSIIPVFFSMKECGFSNKSLFETLLTRDEFSTFSVQNLSDLANDGQLAFFLDGWNELADSARLFITSQVDFLRREFPLLRLIASTRKESIDVPLRGIKAKILPLSRPQQRVIVAGEIGSRASAFLERAWRSSGINEIISIPLYLRLLITIADSRVFPSSKEKIIRAMIEYHDTLGSADVLGVVTRGLHRDYLSRLAFRMLSEGKVALTESNARQFLSEKNVELIQQGQLAQPLDPKSVLDILVAHHLLQRSQNDLISFQHQQFQEWFASEEILEVMGNAFKNHTELSNLKTTIFDIPIFEEAIFFATERLSEQDNDAGLLSMMIEVAFAVDPMLASEMIFRSSDAAWAIARISIVKLVGRWHQIGEFDRALNFMIKTGKADFSETFWNYLSGVTEQQIPVALLGFPPFRIGVMGSGIIERLGRLPSAIKRNVLQEMFYSGDLASMEHAVDFIVTCGSHQMRLDALDALSFRRANNLIVKLLEQSDDDVWSAICLNGYIYEDLDDGAAKQRLLESAKLLIANEKDPVIALSQLLHPLLVDENKDRVFDLLTCSELDVTSDKVGRLIHLVADRYPDTLQRALVKRIRTSLKLPWGSKEILYDVQPADDHELAELAIQTPIHDHEINDAVRVSGPEIIIKLLKLAINSEDQYSLVKQLTSTQLEAFAAAIKVYLDCTDLKTLDLLLNVLNRYPINIYEGKNGIRTKQIMSDFSEFTIVWVRQLLRVQDVCRHDFQNALGALSKFPDKKQLELIHGMLVQDISERERELTERLRGVSNNASLSYGNLYRDAFAAVGGDQAVAILNDYILDDWFGKDAAHSLLDIYNMRNGILRDGRSTENLSMLALNRARWAKNEPLQTASEAERIVQVISDLCSNVEISDEKTIRKIFYLSFVTFQMPVHNHLKLVDKILALPCSLDIKRSFIQVIAQAGYVPDSELIMSGIREWISLAEREWWRRKQHKFVLLDWLKLLALSNRPCMLHPALDLLIEKYIRLYDLQGVLSVLRGLNSPGAEKILIKLARDYPEVCNRYEWLDALLGNQTYSSLFALLDLLDENILSVKARVDVHSINKFFPNISELINARFDELKSRYLRSGTSAVGKLIDGILAHSNRKQSIFLMIEFRVKNCGRFDQGLCECIKNNVLRDSPIDDNHYVYSIEPKDTKLVRKELFDLYRIGGAAGELAKESLNYIDVLRDEYGYTATDLRHPDIGSGLAWPPISEVTVL